MPIEGKTIVIIYENSIIKREENVEYIEERDIPKILRDLNQEAYIELIDLEFKLSFSKFKKGETIITVN